MGSHTLAPMILATVFPPTVAVFCVEFVHTLRPHVSTPRAQAAIDANTPYKGEFRAVYVLLCFALPTSRSTATAQACNRLDHFPTRSPRSCQISKFCDSVK